MSGLKIKKGDNVQVLTGKDRGKTGVVSRALPEVRKVIVAGVNVAKKHQRATRATMQGGIIDKDMPIPVANVAPLCPACSTPPRHGTNVATDGPTPRDSQQNRVQQQSPAGAKRGQAG